MVEAVKARSLEETPTWAVAVVCFVMVLISIIIEHIIHLIGKWLTKRRKRALYEALEKIKSELMLLGFMSLLLTIGQGPISEICVPKSVGATWHPCKKQEKDPSEDENGGSDKCAEKACCLDSFKAKACTMRKWKKWEIETTTSDYQFSHDPDRFRFARETSFGRRHLNFWARSPILLWIVLPKVDYLTLRHGFITAHLAPRSQSKFDFQTYIKRSLEEDFKVVVGISPTIWFFAVLFLLFNTQGWYSYLWLPFIPLIVILSVSTKLQVVITQMGLRIQGTQVVQGTPVVQPADDLFWFNHPRLLLYLINFVLFQVSLCISIYNASMLFSLLSLRGLGQYEFGLKSCFHKYPEDLILRITMWAIIQFFCSYVTLPLYALVTQMGTTMRPTIFNERLAKALRNWHQTAKQHVKQNRHSGTVTPATSAPGTPSHTISPVHPLHDYRGESDGMQASLRS
ncbi:hypothetical protein POTOM_052804 [Populus tomentosa]|uniref:MLO-like protein n=1 Tax=Populus tomentosa TaxID=118781 RepID=A0A8X8C7L2_POPTO|nr:hypothetical protein POTOM_052804 [Populus tomentosa]